MERFKNFVVMPLVIIISILTVCASTLPLLWTLVSSFKTDLEIFTSPLALPQSFNLDAYIYAYKMVPVFQFLVNSIIVTFGATGLNIFVVSMASYVVARKKFMLNGFISLIFATTMFTPGICAMFPIYSLMRTLNLLNTKLGLILVLGGSSTAMTFFILRGYFMGIPRELEDAASIDGAGFFRTYMKIMLPMAIPGMATAAIVMFFAFWNNFMTPLIFTNSNSQRTLSIMLNYFKSSFATNYAAMFAGIIMTVLPTVAVFVVFSEKIVGGLAEGSVKG